MAFFQFHYRIPSSSFARSEAHPWLERLIAESPAPTEHGSVIGINGGLDTGIRGQPPCLNHGLFQHTQSEPWGNCLVFSRYLRWHPKRPTVDI